MKKLYKDITAYESRFDEHVKQEAEKHSNDQKRNHTKTKIKSKYLKDISRKIVFEYFKNSKNVLCIGCRDESELSLFETHNLKAMGIDPALSTKKIKQAPAEKILDFFYANEFDFIYACHSLEHVVMPEKVLTNIRSVSKRGCYIILPVIERDTPKKGHPVLYDICKQSKHAKKEELLNSIKADFKIFEPYIIKDIFYIDGHEPEFHICFTWSKQ